MCEFALWPPVAGPGTRVVGYTLFTGIAELDEYQGWRIEHTAARWGWDVVGIWAEDGQYVFSGTEDRPEFSAMVGDLEGLGVGVVLVGEAMFLGLDAATRFAMVRRIEAASGAAGAVVSAVPWDDWLELGIRGR